MNSFNLIPEAFASSPLLRFPMNSKNWRSDSAGFSNFLGSPVNSGGSASPSIFVETVCDSISTGEASRRLQQVSKEHNSLFTTVRPPRFSDLKQLLSVREWKPLSLISTANIQEARSRCASKRKRPEVWRCLRPLLFGFLSF